VYFGATFGEVFMRYYRYRDAMEQEARFFERSDDDGIRRRLVAFADSLGLPAEASRLDITRTTDRIEISAEWSEHVDVPLFGRVLHYARDLHFAPRVEQSR
jgi:hypothetical protein